MDIANKLLTLKNNDTKNGKLCPLCLSCTLLGWHSVCQLQIADPVVDIRLMNIAIIQKVGCRQKNRHTLRTPFFVFMHKDALLIGSDAYL